MNGQRLKMASPAPNAPLKQGDENIYLLAQRGTLNIPIKELRIRQTFRNTMSDMLVMSEDPNLLESNDIVVRIRELLCNGLDAFCQILRYIFKTPKKMIM